MHPIRRLVRWALFLPIPEAEALEVRLRESDEDLACKHEAFLTVQQKLDGEISTIEDLLNGTLRQTRGKAS